MNHRPHGFYFLTPVWGVSYIKLYLETVIPAQLAPGNLPAFGRDPGSRYIIFTTPEGAAQIRSSPVFTALNNCVPVSFELITDSIHVAHDMMTACFRSGIAMAEDAGAGILFLTPDIVFAAGSFAAIKGLSDAGRDVVFIPAIRTIKSGIVAQLRGLQRGAVIEIASRDLMRLAMDNLHPLADSSWWEEGEGDLIPANLYWRVTDEGIVARCFHLHPIFVNPQRRNVTFFGTVDDDYVAAACPDRSRDHVVTDSDEMLAVELSDPRHAFGSMFSKGSVKDAVRWAEQATDGRHRKLFDSTIRMHAGAVDHARWLEAEEKASAVADAIKRGLSIPSWRLIIDTDMLVRRFRRRATDYRLKVANKRRLASIPAHSTPWGKSTSLILVKQAISLRRGLVEVVRQFLRKIEKAAGSVYDNQLAADFISLAPDRSGAVVIIDNPVRPHLPAALAGSPDRFFSIARQGRRIFYEKDRAVTDLSTDLVVLEVDAFRTADISKYLDEAARVLVEEGSLLVYLHRLTVVSRPGSDPLRLTDLVGIVSQKFDVVECAEQGGLGSYLRVEAGLRIRGIINHRPLARWALQVIAIPLAPLFGLLGGFAVLLAVLADYLDRSGRFSVSSLVLARKFRHSDESAR